MAISLKLGPKPRGSRLPSSARPSELKSARAPAIGHDSLDRYLRAVNYLAAAQVYLQANPLLEKPLRPEHIRERLLGHWGTCPGINFIYTHLNRLIRETDASVLLLTGPGHGAAANLANLYVEGSLQEVYPDLTPDRAGLERFVKRFSWPGGFASHLNPELPGVIHEGGELGYALATAFGAVFDNTDIVAACIVGDGEAESGPTAGAWHSGKFLNPATDGAVLPILLLNEFKIANPTLFASMTDDELHALFTGNGWQARIVSTDVDAHRDMAAAFDWAYGEIRSLQRAGRNSRAVKRPRWPMIILRTPKGWTGPVSVDGKAVEGSYRAHQVPAKECKTNRAHLKVIDRWLHSYRPEELWDEEGRLHADILALCPKGDRRMGMNPHTNGGKVRRPLDLPPFKDFAVEARGRGEVRGSGMETLGKYLAEVVRRSEPRRHFRIVCPDEIESNKLGAVFQTTQRQFAWPVPRHSDNIAPSGAVLEVLSEHNCQGWLQGYILTGRHGLFPCYEAFISIVDGMMNQYAKFLKAVGEVSWRAPVSSLNYLLTSETWRQEHNGYSHQGPGFINNLLTKKGQTYRIYLPPDANTLLSTVRHCLRSTGYINLIIAAKHPLPQWLSPAEADEHCRVGASVWRWASTHGGEEPDVVLAGCGDNLTMEVMAAAQILSEEAPAWRVRVVNVTDLQVIGIPQKYPHGLDEDRFQRLFPLGCPVVFNFHGYTAAIKQLLWERPENERFDVNGYREEGTTTTPFDMQVRNKTSRWHLVIQTAQKLAAHNPRMAALAEDMIRKYEHKVREHYDYVRAMSIDPPEILNWRWKLRPAGK